MRTLRADPWLPYLRPRAACRRRLFCFPYAGGSASIYQDWADALPAGIEVCAVQLPGRGQRVAEPADDRLERLVPRLVDALSPYLTVPFALFGHSMGAIVCFELARALRRRGLRTPTHLFASGRRGPRCPDPDPTFHQLADEDLVAKVRDLNGTPEELLRNRELMTLVMPGLRADFAISENYAYVPDVPLECPIHVLGGDSDRSVGPEELAAWRQETAAACTVQVFAGDHFFIHSARRQVLETLRDVLRQPH